LKPQTAVNPNRGFLNLIVQTKKKVFPYQFIKVVEAADVSVVEEYLRHGVPARSFLRFCSPLGIVVQIDVDVIYAKFLHFVLGSHTKRTASDRENNDSSFHG